MNTRRVGALRVNEGGDSRIGKVRVRINERRHFAALQVALRQYDRGSLSCRQVFAVAGISQKAERAGPRVHKGGHARHAKRRLATQYQAESNGQLAEAVFRGLQ